MIVLSLLGCAALGLSGNHVDGEIDGDKVKLKEAIFVTTDAGDGVVQVIAAGADELCEAMAQFEDERLEADTDADDLSDLWKALFPEEFWMVSVTMHLDPSKELKGEVLDGVDWDGVMEDDDFSGTFSHYKQHLDEGFYMGERDADKYVDDFLTDEGTLSLSAYKSETRLSGSMTTTAVDLDGDEEGDIVFDFSAAFCEPLADVFDDAAKLKEAQESLDDD